MQLGDPFLSRVVSEKFFAAAREKRRQFRDRPEVKSAVSLEGYAITREDFITPESGQLAHLEGASREEVIG
jgi:hypothetical protein